MIFESARNVDGDAYMGMFMEAMRNASLEDMCGEVQDACEYFESFQVPNERTRNRLNNATYTITQIVTWLVGRTADAEAKLARAGDDRAHAEAERLRQRASNFAGADSDIVSGAMAAATRAAAESIDPYVERDGQLVRKSDGKPVSQ